MDQITRISVDRLHESPFNPRRTFGETGLQELAADIKHQGVLSPLLVRPRVPELFAGTDDPNAIAGYELVFGHRRLRGALLAGLVDVPCMVRAMTDEEAKRAQISENLAREDVHPIEEAEGFQALIDDGSETADSLAERYGKSRSYVYGRLTLLKACKEIRDACVAGKIGSEVALLISRLRTDKLQTKALARIKSRYYSLSDGGTRSYREIRDLLREEFTLSLKGDCMFDTADALLLDSAGACTTCPKRAGNAPEFQDLATDRPGRWHDHVVKGEPDLCTDPDCYDAKKKAHLRARAAELEGKGKTVIEGAKARAAIGADGKVKGAYIALKDVRDEVSKARTAAQRDSKIVPPLVVTIQDPRTGKTVEAVKESDLVAAGTRKATPKAQKQENSWQERQRRVEEERKANEEKAVKLTEMNRVFLERVRAAVHQTQRDAQDLHLVARVAVDGVGHGDITLLAKLWGCSSKDGLVKKLGSMSAEDLTKLLMDCVLVEGVVVRPYNLKNKPDTLLATAKRYGVSLAPEASTPLPPAARAPKGGKGRPAKAAKTPSPAARAQDKAEASGAAGQDKASAGSAGDSQKDEAGFAGEEQMDDAGVTAGGCDAEVAA